MIYLLLFFALFSLLHAQEDPVPMPCLKSGAIELVENAACDSLTVFSLRVNVDTCYDVAHGCNSDLNVAECDGKTLEECVELMECRPKASMKIHNGTLFFYPLETGCRGMEFTSGGCVYDLLNFNGYRQIDARQVVADSLCPPKE